MRILFAVLAAVAVFVSAGTFAHAAETDQTLDLFKKSFQTALVSAGKDFGACEFTVVGEEPDGSSRLILVVCPKAPFGCVFLVTPNDERTDVGAQPVECAPNPAYEDSGEEEAPKTSI